METESAKIRIQLQMSLVIAERSKVPVVRVGRIAGQYAKPRSSPFEVHFTFSSFLRLAQLRCVDEQNTNGTSLPSFKGDNVNRFEATQEARRHDPARLLEGHFHSIATLNYIRAFLGSGIAVGIQRMFLIVVVVDFPCRPRRI